MTGDYKTFRVDEALVEDVDYLATRLRAQDLAEIHSDHTAHDALMTGLFAGDSYTILVNEVPVGMFGCCEVEGLLSVWLLGSDAILKIRKSLVVFGRAFVDALIGNHEFGCNAVWIENEASIKWLKHIGAEFGDPVNIDNKKFLPFKIYPTTHV